LTSRIQSPRALYYWRMSSESRHLGSRRIETIISMLRLKKRVVRLEQGRYSALWCSTST
jgi:hypothetical protein